MYNAKIIMKILDKIRELHVDLLDAHQWIHLLPQRQKELEEKYG